MSIPARPTFATLVRVIALGIAQTHDRVTITLYSLELYTDGILINYGVEFDRTREPIFTITASDDRGVEYQLGGGGGGFGGSSVADRARMFMRAQGGLVPALTSGARSLSITFALAQWFDYARDISPQDRVIPIDDLIGPWQFIVPVPLPEEG